MVDSKAMPPAPHKQKDEDIDLCAFPGEPKFRRCFEAFVITGQAFTRLRGHLERSEAESKDPVEGPFDFTTGFLPPSHKATARQATWVGMTVCESGELHAEQFALPGHEHFFGAALVRSDRLQSSA